MHHELRAILDRFIYEHAGVRHLLFAAPPEADARIVEGSGGTTVQMVAHFADAQEGFSTMVARWLAGDAIDGAELDPEVLSSGAASLPADTSREDVLERYAASLRGLFAAFHQIHDERFAGPFGPSEARQVLTAWSQHQVGHIFPFLKVLPETRYDPVIVNWLARTPVPNGETLAQQREYIADVREYYARLAAEEGDNVE